MNKVELKKNLDELGIQPGLYSLNGDLTPDAVIIYNSYTNWQVFYLSERGTRDNLKHFNSESDACQYVLELFKQYQ